MQVPDFLQQDTDGEIRLTGHRIGLFHIIHYYDEGESAEALACRFPTVSLGMIHKVIAFYLEHRSEVDSYIGDCRKALANQRAVNPRRVDLVELRQRIAVRQAAEEHNSARS